MSSTTDQNMNQIYGSTNPDYQPNLKKLMKAMSQTMIDSSKSLLKTHKAMGKEKLDQPKKEKMKKIHNELSSTMKSFRERFGLVLNDMKYLTEDPKKKNSIDNLTKDLSNPNPKRMNDKELGSNLNDLANMIDPSKSTKYDTMSSKRPDTLDFTPKGKNNESKMPNNSDVNDLPKSLEKNSFGRIGNSDPSRIKEEPKSKPSPQSVVSRKIELKEGSIYPDTPNLYSTKKTPDQKSNLMSTNNNIYTRPVTNRGHASSKLSSNGRPFYNPAPKNGAYTPGMPRSLSSRVISQPQSNNMSRPLTSRDGLRRINPPQFVSTSDKKNNSGAPSYLRRSMSANKPLSARNNYYYPSGTGPVKDGILTRPRQGSGGNLTPSKGYVTQDPHNKHRSPSHRIDHQPIQQRPLSSRRIDKPSYLLPRNPSREKEINLTPIPKPKQKFNEKREKIINLSPLKNDIVQPRSMRSRSRSGPKGPTHAESNIQIDEVSGRTTVVNSVENTPIVKHEFKPEMVFGEYVRFRLFYFFRKLLILRILRVTLTILILRSPM